MDTTSYDGFSDFNLLLLNKISPFNALQASFSQIFSSSSHKPLQKLYKCGISRHNKTESRVVRPKTLAKGMKTHEDKKGLVWR
nr:MAG TPA: hypothetical protein [Caudoviricetes sp.]